jgi:Putative amidoligase enzyme
MPSNTDGQRVCAVCTDTECRHYRCSSCAGDYDPEMYRQCDLCQRCNGCCYCWNCAGCDERQNCNTSSGCGNCSRCTVGEERCCQCGVCSNCDDRVNPNRICATCSRCRDCCRCTQCTQCNVMSATVCRDCQHCTACPCTCTTDTCTCCAQPLTRCYCLNCHTIDPETGTISSSHLYNPTDGNPNHTRCRECSSCMEHCSALTCGGCNRKVHNTCQFCNQCTACCTCIICMNTSARHVLASEELRCVSCTLCEEHCSCPRCPGCNKKGKGTCKFCATCKDCCINSEASLCGGFGKSSPVQETQSKLFKWTPTLATRRRMRNDRLIGVELEVNGVGRSGYRKAKPLNQALTKWRSSVVRDGSIGSLPEAFEINAQPSAGDLFLDQMKDLTEGLRIHLDGNTPNEKCGIHVHIDASDLTVYDLSRLVRVYRKVERAMYGLVHPRRLCGEGARYCIPCGKELYDKTYNVDPLKFRRALVGLLYNQGQDPTTSFENYAAHYFGKRMSQLSPEEKKHTLKHAPVEFAKQLKKNKEHKYRDVRYKSLNLHSYFLRKTIEFRHHHGSIDYDEIVGWGQVCQELVTFSQRLSGGGSQTVNQFIESLPRNSRKSLLAIMPNHLHPYMIKQWKVNDDIATRLYGLHHKQTVENTWGTRG